MANQCLNYTPGFSVHITSNYCNIPKSHRNISESLFGNLQEKYALERDVCAAEDRASEMSIGEWLTRG